MRLYDGANGFPSVFVDSLFYVVLTSATVGYEQMMPAEDADAMLKVAAQIIVGYVFFSLYVAFTKQTIQMAAMNYGSLQSQAADDFETWVTQRYIGEGPVLDSRFGRPGNVFRKVTRTYKEYLERENVTTLRRSDFYSKLTDSLRRLLTVPFVRAFERELSYLAKTIGARQMERLYLNFELRM